jgi:hypothetical protein
VVGRTSASVGFAGGRALGGLVGAIPVGAELHASGGLPDVNGGMLDAAGVMNTADALTGAAAVCLTSAAFGAG